MTAPQNPFEALFPMKRFCAFLFPAVLAFPICGFAQNVDDWNAKRAALFSAVCMGSAPSFSELESRAVAAGFEQTADGLHFAPEVYVSLSEGDTVCRCLMSVGAPDPDSMIIALFERMIDDHGDGLQHNGEGGTANDNVFVVSGTPVRVVFEPRVIDEQTWFMNVAIREGACPS